MSAPVWMESPNGSSVRSHTPQRGQASIKPVRWARPVPAPDDTSAARHDMRPVKTRLSQSDTNTDAGSDPPATARPNTHRTRYFAAMKR
jgi:hypothetical protein